MELKLNYKKTSRVGLAFAIIILFWNTYDFVIPLLIENAFGLSNAARGAVMGLDNLLSLFMLPWFGKLSDKSKNKRGRRTPFIVIGTISAVILMVFIPITAQKQLTEANAERAYYQNLFDNDQNFREEQFASWYDLASGIDPETGEVMYNKKGEKFHDYTYISKMDYNIMTGQDKLGRSTEDQQLTKEQFSKLTFTIVSDKKVDGVKVYKVKDTVVTQQEYDAVVQQNVLYNKYAKTGVNTFLSKQVEKITFANPGRLVGYLIVLFMVLIAMGTFRSPAVALMPDVTPKPLRSQANAIINLAGGVGGAISFLIYQIVLAINPTGFIAIYFLTAGCMLILLALFCKLVNEPKYVLECQQICEEYGISNDNDDDSAIGLDSGITDAEKVKLKKSKNRSFLLILASIFMWFMGYNAVTSNLSVYSTKALGLSAGTASLISGISMAISAIAFIPVGIMAEKIGRRKSIMIGFLLAVISYLLIWLFLTPGSSAMVLFTLFYLISGFGLIIANVNTFPMVVELSSAGDVGKYTGYYYMATMSAQAITPYIAGLFMDNISIKTLFIYSSICVAISTILMFFVKHGDSKPVSKKKLIEHLADAD